MYKDEWIVMIEPNSTGHETEWGATFESENILVVLDSSQHRFSEAGIRDTGPIL